MAENLLKKLRDNLEIVTTTLALTKQLTVGNPAATALSAAASKLGNSVHELNGLVGKRHDLKIHARLAGDLNGHFCVNPQSGELSAWVPA